MKSLQTTNSSKHTIRSNSLGLALVMVGFVLFNLAIHQFYAIQHEEQEELIHVSSTGVEEELDIGSGKELGQREVDKYMLNILGVPPEGSPPNLPSEGASGSEEHKENIQWIRDRNHYGGEGDEKHLGGFTSM